MNAYAELFPFHPTENKEYVEGVDYIGVCGVPCLTKEKVLKELENIKWARVIYLGDCSDEDEDNSIHAVLPSERTIEDEKRFIEDLGNIEYNNGRGSQELFGHIVFKDGTWLERADYDGSEWWVLKMCPKEPKGLRFQGMKVG